ncbi:MAG: rhodanese-like domain-containing protein [Micavibrio sp.]|nr:MAG: rhodanese-like domain-containing protein [Micavibrio sp.]
MKTITRDEISAHLERGDPIRLVEALPQQHYEDGHLPGAVQLLPDEAKEKAPQLFPEKDALIVTYCANTQCQNSVQLANILTGLGYTNVAEYSGGKQDWTEAGLPLEKQGALSSGSCAATGTGGGCG